MVRAADRRMLKERETNEQINAQVTRFPREAFRACSRAVGSYRQHLTMSATGSLSAHTPEQGIDTRPKVELVIVNGTSSRLIPPRWEGVWWHGRGSPGGAVEYGGV